MNAKATKEEFAGRIDFCRLLILEAHLQNSFDGWSRSAAPGRMKQNAC